MVLELSAERHDDVNDDGIRSSRTPRCSLAGGRSLINKLGFNPANGSSPRSHCRGPSAFVARVCGPWARTAKSKADGNVTVILGCDYRRRKTKHGVPTGRSGIIPSCKPRPGRVFIIGPSVSEIHVRSGPIHNQGPATIAAAVATWLQNRAPLPWPFSFARHRGWPNRLARCGERRSDEKYL